MKRLLELFIIIFAVLYSSNIIAQEVGAMRKSLSINFPEKIQQPLSDPLPAGTYSIGSSGYFPTIDSAFNKLSIDGVEGNVTLELIDNLYIPTDIEFGFILIGPIPGAGPGSRVTIKPAENKNVIVQNNGSAVFLMLDVSYITFDGVAITGPTTLTIHAFENTLYGFNDGIDFVDDCNNNVMQNINFIIDDNKRQSGSGFWFTVVGDGPDNNLIQNNFVKKAGLGLYIIASSSSYRGKNNIIRGNLIGSETDSLTAYGICAGQCENTLIENNIIQNLKATLTGTNVFQIGILSENGYRDIIRNNIVSKLRSISGYTTAGIVLAGSGGSLGIDIEAYNNIIYDIQSTSSQSNSRLSGIELWYVSKPKVYYNSINISGNGANPLGSAALYINVGVTDVELKNNILVNNRNESPYCASVIRILPGTTFSITDFNDFYYTAGSNNCLVRLGSTEYMTLTDWQNAIGQDLNSIFEMPHFISSTDLHIDKTYPTNLERGATPIAEITTDYDGDTRNASTPDIGADEFDGYTFEDPLPAGTYSIGTGGNFATIQDVFTKLETDGVAGNVTLELIDELYTAPTDSFGFKLNGPIPGAGLNRRVTIKPSENKNVIIEGYGRAVLFFINTSYITFDGASITGSTTLTVHTYGNYQFEYNLGLFFVDNSDHNIIQNGIFINDDISRRSPALGVSSLSYTAATPDSNLIQSNFVKKAGIGIYVSAYYSTVPATANSNVIRKNIIGSETDTLISWGIQVERNHNAIIEDNLIEGIRCASTDFVIAHGIGCWSCLESEIRNNVIHNVNTSYTGGSMGIALMSDGIINGNGNLVYNNMIYDINSSSSSSMSNIGGIHLESQNNTKIYYNSVYLYGTGANQQGSGALYIWTPGFNTEVKNNIFVNTRDEGPFCASAIHLKTLNIILSSSDFNVLNYEPNNYNCLVKSNSGSYHSLTEWQATGYDLHSYVEMPHFVEPYLHIDSTIATYLEARGTPIAGIDTDYDGQLRNSLTPDIGADEMNGIVGVEDEETLPTEYALEQNYPNPFNPATTFRYSIPTQSSVVIKVYDILGNEIATLLDEEKSVGTYELTWNAGSLPSGVYFYQLRAGEFIETRKMMLIK